MKKDVRQVDLLLVLLAGALLAAWQGAGQPLSPRPAVISHPLSPRPANALIGTWQDPVIELTFQANGTLELTYKEHKYGRRTGTYRVDFSQPPAELDLRLDETCFHSCEITAQGALRISEKSLDPAQRPRTFGPRTLVLYRQPRGADPSST